MTANGRQNADTVLVASLAAGQTYAAAAEAAGVSERTARRRMSDPSFIRRVDAGRVEIVSAAVNRAVDAAVEAVDTMIELMRGAESESVRLRAASGVLEFVGTRNGDPVGDAIRGLRTFSGSDVAGLTRRLAETALEHVPAENVETFLNDLEAKLSVR